MFKMRDCRVLQRQNVIIYFQLAYSISWIYCSKNQIYRFSILTATFLFQLNQTKLPSFMPAIIISWWVVFFQRPCSGNSSLRVLSRVSILMIWYSLTFTESVYHMLLRCGFAISNSVCCHLSTCTALTSDEIICQKLERILSKCTERCVSWISKYYFN